RADPQRADVDLFQPADEPRIRDGGRGCGRVSGRDARPWLRDLPGRGHLRYHRRLRWHDGARSRRRRRERGRVPTGEMASAVEGVMCVRWRISVAFVSFVAFVPPTFGACGAGQGSGANRRYVRLAVGGQNQLVYLPTTLAQELGFYKEEGLDVELQDHAGGAKALQSLVGGSSDVVSGFYDHTVQMAAEGRECGAFVTMLRFPGLVLVTSPQGAAVVTKIEDLKGRVAGVTAAGSSSQMLLTYMLQRHGLALDDVSITPVGS